MPKLTIVNYRYERGTGKFLGSSVSGEREVSEETWKDMLVRGFTGMNLHDATIACMKHAGMHVDEVKQIPDVS